MLFQRLYKVHGQVPFLVSFQQTNAGNVRQVEAATEVFLGSSSGPLRLVLRHK